MNPDHQFIFLAVAQAMVALLFVLWLLRAFGAARYPTNARLFFEKCGKETAPLLLCECPENQPAQLRLLNGRRFILAVAFIFAFGFATALPAAGDTPPAAPSLDDANPLLQILGPLLGPKAHEWFAKLFLFQLAAKLIATKMRDYLAGLFAWVRNSTGGDDDHWIEQLIASRLYRDVATLLRVLTRVEIPLALPPPPVSLQAAIAAPQPQTEIPKT